jgi:signal transduction histidine kinase
LGRATFTLEIEDDGRGMAGVGAPLAQTRNGLRNMRRRMEDIRGGFAIAPGPDGGTVVRLTAPLGTDKTDARAPALSDLRE